MYEQSIGVVLAVLVTLAHRVCEHLVPIVLRLDAIVAVTLSRLRPLQEMDLCHVPAKSFVGEVIVVLHSFEERDNLKLCARFAFTRRWALLAKLKDESRGHPCR